MRGEALHEKGFIDAHLLINGHRKGGFTRLANTIHTRIDRIYSPNARSTIAWQTLGPHPALFTGKGSSDHLPLLGTFDLIGHNPERKYDIRINLDLMEDKRIRATISYLWKANINADTPDDQLGDAWYKAKMAVASYLLWLTKNEEEPSPTTHLITELAILGVQLGNEAPDPRTLDRMRAMNEEIALIRSKRSISGKTAFNALKHEERMTKEFFRRFQARTTNQAIPELFITEDWEEPGTPDRDSTKDDVEIRHQLRKYYKWLYQDRKTIRDADLEEALSAKPLTPNDSTKLEGAITLEELQNAIRGIGSGKSAGPDSIPAEFYASFEGRR